MTEVVFTAAQRAAIEVAGPPLDTCVVAGPGSGKTTVLVEHFRQLVEAGANPQRILAITFTEKAAANIRAKLAEACPEIRAQLERAWVSTVHGFCARLLKENAVFAAVDPEFSVADPSDSWRLQQESIAAAVEELFEEQPAAVRALIRGLSAFDFEEALLSAYDAMRSAGKQVEDLAGFAQPAGTGMADFAATAAALAADAATSDLRHFFRLTMPCARPANKWKTWPALPNRLEPEWPISPPPRRPWQPTQPPPGASPRNSTWAKSAKARSASFTRPVRSKPCARWRRSRPICGNRKVVRQLMC